MTKAIHFKNEKEGTGRKGMTRWREVENGYRSCCWLLTESEQTDLLGGWIYFHETKAARSMVGGRILGFEPAERTGAIRVDGVAILFQSDPNGRSQLWRGAKHMMAYSSGVVDADLPHEQA